MKLITLFVAVLNLSSVTQSPPKVFLRGIAKDCHGGPYLMPGIRIFALDFARHRRIVESLHTMEANGKAAKWDPFFSEYGRLLKMVEHSAALSRATSKARGVFTLTVNPADSLLVFGYGEFEGMPEYYGYRVVRARSSRNFILDMSCVRSSAG